MTSHESMSENRGCGMDAVAYVLGALEGDELEAFRAHLATCALCRDEVGAFQEVVDTLPLLAPPQPVPRGLKRRVMSQVRAEPRPSSKTNEQTKARTRTFRFPRPLITIPSPALVASVLVLAVVVAVGAIALSSGGGATSHIYSASVTGPGTAKLTVTGARGELVVHGMPRPPGTDVYEVWLQRGKQPPTPTTALFSVTADGSATVGVPGNLHGVGHVLVTPEPPGGSKAPTHAPVIVARLS
jgi:anti-sigma-K factor RskA